jgi:hypothetical protein
MVLLISYDLNGHERPEAYEAVKDVITNNATAYIKPLYSQWFVQTDESVGTWVDWLKEVTDRNDRLFVLKVQRPYQGLLTDKQWEWLRERI